MSTQEITSMNNLQDVAVVAINHHYLFRLNMPLIRILHSWRSWLRHSPTFARNPDSSVGNLYIEYKVSEWSFGRISRLGYYQYLADYLAQEIIQALKSLYNIQDPTDGHLRILSCSFEGE